ncbi:MAG: hypothetical protein JXJ04_26125 [Spirochaetales bacterium]|nr:hypothetical protein [Spirochaetales bacterium]
MKKTLVHKNEFCTIEENGAKISITYGYTRGIAVVERFTIKQLFFRNYVLWQRMKAYKKRGFKRAGIYFEPDPTTLIYLEDYKLPESRYCENTGTNHFFEAGLDSGFIYTREGQIDGLGIIKKYELDSGDNREAAVAKRDDLIKNKLDQGYVERFTGASYSLRVIAAEYEAK